MMYHVVSYCSIVYHIISHYTMRIDTIHIREVAPPAALEWLDITKYGYTKMDPTNVYKQVGYLKKPHVDM